MNAPSDLFRREALEFWSRQRGPDGVLRVASPWVRWLYWAVLALVAAGLAVTFLAPIEQTTSGPAFVDPQERTFVAVLPAEVADVQDGRPLRLDVDGPGGWQDVAATARHVEAVEDADVERIGFTSFPRPALLVTGVLAPDAVPVPEASSAQLTGRAVVVLGSKPAFSVFLHGFGGASEGGDG
jgi:hypothetical protein